jgi:ribonuclease HII
MEEKTEAQDERPDGSTNIGGEAPAPAWILRPGGIDEAGRGCVIGPLVIAGVSADREALDELRILGVKDSKLLTREKREVLYEEIKSRSRVIHHVHVQPPEIDEYVRNGKRYRKLNFLEALHMAKVIPILDVETVFVDAPDTNPGRFTLELAAMLLTSPVPRIVAEHRADRNHIVVSAASIVAKVERDLAVERLRALHGDFGSGYPSDAKTIAYLRDWVRKEGYLPDFSRKSWKTWTRILSDTLAP